MSFARRHSHQFNTVDEITAFSYAIVIVEVDSVEYEEFARNPFTFGQVNVKEVIKDSSDGQITVGSTLMVGEMGGRIRRELKESPGEFGDEFLVGVGGVLPIREGRTYLMFLDAPSRIGPREGAYVPVGAFQGKMELTDNGRIEFEGEDEILADNQFAVPRALDGRAWDDVRAEIRLSVAAGS